MRLAYDVQIRRLLLGLLCCGLLRDLLWCRLLGSGLLCDLLCCRLLGGGLLGCRLLSRGLLGCGLLCRGLLGLLFLCKLEGTRGTGSLDLLQSTRGNTLLQGHLEADTSLLLIS